MLAATPAEAGEVIVWTGAVVAALGVITRTPPVRWLWRRLVTEPVMAAMRQVVGEVVDEKLNARPLTNGWGTKAVAAIAHATNADVGPPDDDNERTPPPEAEA